MKVYKIILLENLRIVFVLISKRIYFIGKHKKLVVMKDISGKNFTGNIF